MDIGTLLSSLTQSLETSTISQVAADGSAKAPSGGAVASTTSANGLTVQVAPIMPGGVAAAGTGTTLTPAGVAGATGSVTLTLPGAPAAAGTSTGMGLVPVPNGAPTATGSLTATAFTPFVALRLPPAGPAVSSGLADVYYGSGAPASPSLLSQSGVGAYIQLVNALAAQAGDAKSAEQLTNSLGAASTTLKSAYYDAVSQMPVELQGKDWSFSVFAGKLVFTAGADSLSPQDFAALQKAFASSSAESAANQLANALTSIEARQKAGDDSTTLAWSRIAVDETNFSDVVNLRDYVTGNAPGGKYTPSAPPPETRPEIPNILGGMDLRGLVSARPNFFRPDGSVITEEPDPSETADMEEDAGTVQGQCSCGEVHFTVENAFEYAFYCHCSRCRLRTGSAFATIAGIEIDKVEVTTGREHLSIEGDCSDGYGARCGLCHSFLFAAVRGRQYMHVSLGVLQGTPNRLPDHHIYVGSKAPWFQITDALPQYDELP